jgi:molecular chaperone DnaK (HSP70)
MATKGSYNVRPVFTYPHPTGDSNSDENRFIECYRNAVNELTAPLGIASFVSEPVATVTGAEYFNLLPPKGSGESVIVVDVGGSSTSISLVNGDKEVLHSMQLEFGGDTFVDALVSHLIRTFDGFKYEPQSSSKPTLSDTAALQRLYEASTSAVHELSSKTRSEINIPYLTMDLESRQPKHLEVGMARAVVENEVENYICKSLVPALNNEKTNVLSQALQSPSTLSALFSSVIMSMLEQTAHTPYNLRAILLVGGGSRIPLVRESLKSGVAVLAGDAYVNGAEGKRLIIPGGEMGDELNVIGAAISASGG